MVLKVHHLCSRGWCLTACWPLARSWYFSTVLMSLRWLWLCPAGSVNSRQTEDVCVEFGIILERCWFESPDSLAKPWQWKWIGSTLSSAKTIMNSWWLTGWMMCLSIPLFTSPSGLGSSLCQIHFPKSVLKPELSRIYFTFPFCKMKESYDKRDYLWFPSELPQSHPHFPTIYLSFSLVWVCSYSSFSLILSLSASTSLSLPFSPLFWFMSSEFFFFLLNVCSLILFCSFLLLIVWELKAPQFVSSVHGYVCV